MKTTKIICSLFIALLITPFASAQSNKNAENVLNNVVKILQTGAIQTNFGLVVKQPNSQDHQVTSGKYTMQGNKFMLETNDMKVYFDGVTQWAYMPKVNEVTITNPTEKELAETNPMALLDAYKSKSIIRFLKTNAKKDINAVELTPKDKSSDFKNIVVKVNKINNYPLSIQLIDKKGMISTLAFDQFKTGIKTTADTFIFDSKKYKDIEINDLR